jgi:hypothetical protein
MVLYEETTSTRDHHICCVHHASVPRGTFETGIRDAAHQALMVLHQDSATLWCMQYCHFLSKESDSSEVRIHANVHDDPT